MKILKHIHIIFIFISTLFINSCGYKLGDLEVIGENSSKTASINIKSSDALKQVFKNSGFTISQSTFDYLVITEGPFYKKEITSVTSNAVANEYTVTGSIILSLLDKNENKIIDRKIITFSKDHKFSSSEVNSSSREEDLIKDDIRKNLQFQVLNQVRNKI